MNYSIGEFWKKNLAGVVRTTAAASLSGWASSLLPNPWFVEPELHLRPDFENLSAPIWLIAAPGAVGKSTFAREISAQTGAAYLDLAKADTVAGNYLTGGLVKNNLFSLWQQNQAAVLIDALDEARLRVTQNSFEDFLRDVKGLSNGRSLPTMLFGRVGIIEEAWLLLSEQGIKCPIFDIAFFDTRRAERFVTAALGRLSTEGRYNYLAGNLASNQSVYADVSARFVAQLSKISASDGTRFAGYAPVLEAVATVLAAVRNPATLGASITDTVMDDVLQHLAQNILEREATKLRDQLEAIPSDVKNTLYTPSEQLDRLAAVILGTPSPPLPAGLRSHQMTAYDNAVHTLLPQHPFLDGTGHQPSGAVFAAVINAQALFSSSAETVAAAEMHAGRGPHTPNPFLIDFYLHRTERDATGTPVVPPEHVVVVYESVRARAAAGDLVRLSVDSDEDDDDLDVEIQIGNGTASGPDRQLIFKTSAAGTLRFGRQVNGVFIDAPDLEIVVGAGSPVEMLAPVSLNVGRISFDCSELVVQLGDPGVTTDETSVTIEARELADTKIVNSPIVRQGAVLAVSWPGANSYPWTHFAAIFNGDDAQNADEALLGLRRLAMAFRSHSRGRLARFRGKIEHRRITKGNLGVVIRERMIKDGILSLEGNMYFLNPAKLGELVGTSYHDLRLKKFSQRAREYASSLG